MVSLESWGGLDRQVGDLGRLWFGFELQNRTKMEVCWAEVGAMLRPSRIFGGVDRQCQLE